MSNRSRPNLPSPPPGIGSALRSMLAGLLEQVRVWRGDVGDRRQQVVTFGDLEGSDAGVVRFGPGGPRVDSRDESTEVIRQQPLTNLQASPVFEKVILEWDGINQRGYAFTEIWRATVDDLGQAVRRGTSIAAVFTDSATPGQTYYYWVRAVSTTGFKGAYNDTAGTKATTKNRPEFLLDELTGEITESELYSNLNDRIDLIDGPDTLAGSVNARVQNEKNERVSADDALASDITTLQANVGDNSAAIQKRAEVKVDGNEVSAQYDLRLQTTVDGRTILGGFGLASDGASVEAGFNVDRFWIGHPTVDYTQQGQRFPFIVDSGVVYMDEAMIRQAAIGSAQIGDLDASKITTSQATIADALIGSADIDNAMIGSFIQSDNYSSGSAGWRIEKSGAAEFNDNLTVNAQASIDTLQIADSAVTVPVIVSPADMTVTDVWQNFADSVFTPTQSGLLFVMAAHWLAYSGGWDFKDEEILVNTTTIATMHSGAASHHTTCMVGALNVTAGTTYHIKARIKRDGTQDEIRVAQPQLFYMLSKR